MPSRIFREGVLDSERINRLSKGAEVTFYRLLLVADDFGRFDGRVSVIRSRCYPICRDVQDEHVLGWLQEIQGAGLVHCYVVAGKPYFEILNFRQRTRAKNSKFPALQDAGGELTDIWLSVDGQLALPVVSTPTPTPTTKYVSDSDSDYVRRQPAQVGHVSGNGRSGDSHKAGKRLATYLDVEEVSDVMYGSLPALWCSWAIDERPDLAGQVAGVWARFCDHWKALSGAKGVKVDWEATWRNWVRKESAPRAGRQSALESSNAAVADGWVPPVEPVL